MKVSEMDPTVKEGICIFSALRTLGYPSEDIFVVFQKDEDSGDVLVQLADKYRSVQTGEGIAFRAGPVNEEDFKQFNAFTKLPPEQRKEIVEAAYPESTISMHQVDLVSVLVVHGVYPLKVHRSRCRLNQEN